MPLEFQRERRRGKKFTIADVGCGRRTGADPPRSELVTHEISPLYSPKGAFRRAGYPGYG